MAEIVDLSVYSRRIQGPSHQRSYPIERLGLLLDTGLRYGKEPLQSVLRIMPATFLQFWVLMGLNGIYRGKQGDLEDQV